MQRHTHTGAQKSVAARSGQDFSWVSECLIIKPCVLHPRPKRVVSDVTLLRMTHGVCRGQTLSHPSRIVVGMTFNGLQVVSFLQLKLTFSKRRLRKALVRELPLS